MAETSAPTKPAFQPSAFLVALGMVLTPIGGILIAVTTSIASSHGGSSAVGLLAIVGVLLAFGGVVSLGMGVYQLVRNIDAVAERYLRGGR